MQNKDFRKSIEDFSRAIEQGCAAVYRRNFDSLTYEYIGRYIKEITGYDQTELTPELWDSLILHTEQKGELALIGDAHHFTNSKVFEDDVCLLGVTRPSAE